MSEEVLEVAGVVETTNNTLINEKGEALQTLTMDFKKLCEDFKDSPEAMAQIVEHYCDLISPVAIIMVQDANTWEWSVFEGKVNLRKGTFQVISEIQKFPANQRDYRRPTTQGLNLVSGVALARGLPIWIP